MVIIGDGAEILDIILEAPDNSLAAGSYVPGILPFELMDEVP